MSFRLPLEAYNSLSRFLLDVDSTAGMTEYGLGGAAYAKARDGQEKIANARAWQDVNAPVLFEGSTPIPDVDKETRPNIEDEKIYNDRNDETMLKKIEKIFHNKTSEEVIPVLIVASARALVLDADGDADKLEALGEKFCALLADTATDMMGKESVH